VDAGRKLEVGLKGNPKRDIAQCIIVYGTARTGIVRRKLDSRIGKIRLMGQGEDVLLQILKEILVLAHGCFLFYLQGWLLMTIAFVAARTAGDTPCFLASVPAFYAAVGMTALAGNFRASGD
jgi:hypothetical protein